MAGAIKEKKGGGGNWRGIKGGGRTRGQPQVIQTPGDCSSPPGASLPQDGHGEGIPVKAEQRDTSGAGNASIQTFEHLLQVVQTPGMCRLGVVAQVGQPARVASGPLSHIKGAHGISYGGCKSVHHLHVYKMVTRLCKARYGGAGQVAMRGCKGSAMGGIPRPWRGSQLPWVVA